MVVSDELKTIFFHIPKSAGNSIAVQLKPRASVYHHLSEYKGPKPPIYCHISAESAMKHNYFKDKFDSYFKFTFLRNPWERLFSWYEFAKDRYENSPAHKNAIENAYKFEKGHNFKTDFIDRNFNEWLLETKVGNIKKHGKYIQIRPQLDWVSDRNGNLMVDYVGNVDTINEDWKVICDKLGIPFNSVGKHNATAHKPYTKIYSREAKEHVGKYFKRDIEYFGYKF